ncbi:hypothetical protein ABPG77_005470 [Micractinium sp. CCAP 211/92]
MGLDGGTIISRNDVLRRSCADLNNADTSRSTRGGAIRGVHKRRQLDAKTAKVTQWSTCALSGERLAAPIVACFLGRLYSKAAVLELLLARAGRFADEAAEHRFLNQLRTAGDAYDHITSLHDVFTLQYEPAAAEAGAAAPVAASSAEGGADPELPAPYTCPITQLRCDRHPFAALRPCGHVFSERALKALASGGGSAGSTGAATCPTCVTAYSTADDVVALFPEGQELEHLSALFTQHQEASASSAMAGGGVALSRASALNIADYEGRLTWYVMIVALIASAGGLLFGYDIGITGGVESMAPFNEKFFPEVAAAPPSTDPYCKYNDQKLQVFTSILFLAGMFSSFFAGYVTRHFGRKMTMTIGGLWFLAGAGLNAGARHLWMLIIGRLFLGFGVGFANQVVPLYLSEMAPFKYRGGLNMLFQLAVTVGIIVAQLINWGVYGTNKWDEGWRLSLGLAGVPAVILLLGGLLLPESPNSLVERGHVERARTILERLRGTSRVDAELADIREASDAANKFTLRDSWRIMFTRPYSPMLVVTAMIAMLQQWTGINAIMFYVPVIFSSLGTGAEGALLNTVIIGAVNVVSTFVSILSVDKFGRKFLFIEGGIQMIAAQITTGVVLAIEFPKYNNVLPTHVSIGVLIVICVFVAGFAWSWGPLGWLVPSEIQTLEPRAAGMSVAVTINFLFSFVVGQCFLNMLCTMKWGVFIFFAGWVCLMTLFVAFFLPETKGVPVERIHVRFAKHWFWRKWMGPAAQEIIDRDATRTASRKAAQLETAAHPAPPPTAGPAVA